MFDHTSGNDTIAVGERTRRAILEAAGAALGLGAVGSVASGHPGVRDEETDLADQFAGNRANSASNAELVGYHSLGGVGPASLSGRADEPHYGALSELRVHDDLGFVTAFSSREPTPDRGLAIFDVSRFTRAERRADLEDADLTALSFVRNDNDAASCMDVKISDDGEYAFVCKQPFAALAGEWDHRSDTDDHDTSASATALEVVDVSDPGNPEIVARYDPGVWVLGPHNCWHHQIGGQEYVFTAHGALGLTGGVNVFAFDRDLERLEHVNFWTFDSEVAEAEVGTDGNAYYAHDIVVQDDPRFGIPIAYVSYWNAGTRVLDVSDPTSIEELGVFEMERSHHAVPTPTLRRGKRAFVVGQENPTDDSGPDDPDGGESGYHYLVDADPIDAVLAGERERPVYLGTASDLLETDGYERLQGPAYEDFDPDDLPERTDLDRFALFTSLDDAFGDVTGFEEEAADENHAYEGFESFSLSAHNVDIGVDGTVVAGHYHAGVRFLEITDEWTLEETGHYRVGRDVPRESEDQDLNTGTPAYWSAVLRNGVTFAGGINAGPQAIAHEGFEVGADTPIDLEIEREADGSLFTAGQTSQVRIRVDADEPVRVRDRVPADWTVDEEHSPVTVETIGDDHRQVVTFDDEIEEGTLRYYVEVPDDATDAYTLGPVEYARPDVASEYGGGVSANNALWRKENGETVTKTVLKLET